MDKNIKPRGQKAYGSIPHLPNSRMGPGDHAIDVGSARILTEKVRDKHDVIWCTEKVDGSCCSVAVLNGEVIALGRAGYLASTSKYEMHQLFAAWVRKHEARFKKVLKDGERLCGEWLVQAHGTKYKLTHEPFVVFDLFRNNKRVVYEELGNRLCNDFILPMLLNFKQAISVEEVLESLNTYGFHGAIEPVEGAVWRCERNGNVDFLAKYVRPDKKDGCYLPTETNGDPIWNVDPKSLFV